MTSQGNGAGVASAAPDMCWNMRAVQAGGRDEVAELRLFLAMIAGRDRDHAIEIRHFPGRGRSGGTPRTQAQPPRGS